jgi:hypothetical protein
MEYVHISVQFGISEVLVDLKLDLSFASNLSQINPIHTTLPRPHPISNIHFIEECRLL